MTMKYKPILWNMDKLVFHIQGKWINKPEHIFATGVSIAANNVQYNDIFIAARNNHDKVKIAYKKGACLAIVDKVPEGTFGDLPLLLVDSIQHTLRKIADFTRDNILDSTFIGVTGTAGKTTVKELLFYILQSQGLSHASNQNMNNPASLAASISNISSKCKFGVYEMGMLGPGIVKNCSEIIRPHIGIITTLDYAHFTHHQESINSIIRAKAEIVSGIQDGGVILLPRDNKYYEEIENEVLSYGRKLRILTFGTHQDADFRLLRLTQNDLKMTLELSLMGEIYKVVNFIPTQAFAMSILTALGCIKLMNLDVEEAIAKIYTFPIPFRRGRRYKASYDQKTIEVIDDSWNANPLSMKSALDQLGSRKRAEVGRKVAFIGDMSELGKQSTKLHEELLQTVLKNRIDLVCTVGREMKHLYDILPPHCKGSHFNTSDEAKNNVKNIIQDKDLLLVKASNSIDIWKVVITLIGAYSVEPLRLGNWAIAQKGIL